MTIMLGQTAPDFTQESSRGKIEFHKWLGDSWGILFSHPKDYTPVCTTELAQATLFTTTPALFKGDARKRYDQFETKVQLARYGTDCYAFAMLAAGSVDIVADPGLKPYDIVALIPIIEQAGGVVTRRDGGPAETAGDIVAAASPELHRAALDLLNG